MFRKTIPYMATLVMALSPCLATQSLAAADITVTTNEFWWPEQLDLSPLRQHASDSNPLGENFDYAEAFSKL
ncbi:MAG: hypothetical protein P8104_08115, partial [Gammaproteobacteria bacterium]